MSIEEYLTGYEKIGQVYVREDRKAVGALSTNGKFSLLRILPESKSHFKGWGMTFPESDLFNVRKYYPIFFVNIAKPKGFGITDEILSDFTSSEGFEPIDAEKYLAGLAKKACISYSLDTPKNRARNLIASLNLQYSPFKIGERKELRQKLIINFDRFIEMLPEILTDLSEEGENYIKQNAKIFKIMGIDVNKYRTQAGDYSDSIEKLLSDKDSLKRRVLDRAAKKEEYKSFRGETDYELLVGYTQLTKKHFSGSFLISERVMYFHEKGHYKTNNSHVSWNLNRIKII